MNGSVNGQSTLSLLTVGGRHCPINTIAYLRGLETLTGRSLAASWYITAFTNVGWDVKDERGETLSSDNVSASDIYDTRLQLPNSLQLKWAHPTIGKSP